MVKQLKQEVHKSALIAPSLAILDFILSPDFLNLLPEKYAHLGYLLAVIIATLFPQLLKKSKPQQINGRL